MERRRALVVAGTMTATLAMAGTAMAVNLGLLGSDSDPVGDLTATEIQPAAQREPRPPGAEREPRVRVVFQDIPIVGGGKGGPATGSVESGDDSAPASPSPAPAPSVDDDDDDDSSYDDDQGDDHDDEDTGDSVDEPDDDD